MNLCQIDFLNMIYQYISLRRKSPRNAPKGYFCHLQEEARAHDLARLESQKMLSFNRHFMLHLLMLCFLLNERVIEAEFKQWQPNTNWNNPSNWERGKLPCSQQDVKLLGLQPFVVALSGKAAIRSLSLPMDGELVINNDAELIFSGINKQDSQCSEGDVSFDASEAKNWFNPDNWREVGGDGNPVEFQSNGILHLNQIPCQHDQVQFKQGDSFLVKSGQHLTIASIIMNGKVYTQKTFQDYLVSDTGKIQFQMDKGLIRLTGDTCSDPKGCYCSNTPQVKETVCSFVKCAKIQCNRPLSPAGSCCSFCGVIIMIKPLASFTMSSLRSLVKNLFDNSVQERTSSVQYSISRTQAGLVEVVVVDSFEDGIKAQHFASKLIDKLSGSSDLEITEKLQSSSGSQTSPKKGQSSSNTDLAIGIGVGVGAGVILVIIITMVIVFKRKRCSTYAYQVNTAGWLTVDYSNQGGAESDSQASVKYENMEMQQQGNTAPAEQVNKAAMPDTSDDEPQYKSLESDNALYESTDKKQTFENPLYESSTELVNERQI